MRGTKCGLGVAAVLGAVLVAAGVWADDKAEKLTPDKLPAKIMAAVKARFPAAEFTAITKETDAGQVIFDIELKERGRKFEMDILEDGTVREVEKEVALKDVPDAVTKAVQAKYPKATIKEVMEVNFVKDGQEKPDHFEVVIETADKKTMDVEVSPDGKTVKVPPDEPAKKPGG
jgi:hypothetical protein